MLVTSIFSFPLNVFKSILFQGNYNRDCLVKALNDVLFFNQVLCRFTSIVYLVLNMQSTVQRSLIFMTNTSIFNPLPGMPILVSSSKDMMSKNMDKWGYNYLIEQKTLWEKAKLFVTSNFPFSHIVLKNCLLMCQIEYLWSIRLTLYLGVTQSQIQQPRGSRLLISFWEKEKMLASSIFHSTTTFSPL